MTTYALQNAVLVLFSITFCSPLFADNSFESLQTEEVVKRKLYPKEGSFEINAPDVGLILNESYVNTYLLHLGVNYYLSEAWGIGVDMALAISQNDKSERECIENFYNDNDQQIAANCGPASEVTNANPNPGTEPYVSMGPAYVPIRQIDNVISAVFTWSPLYGKQLFFRRWPSYFDLFTVFGLGLTNSTFYPKSPQLRNGKTSRGNGGDVGASPSETGSYGIEGRPDPESQSNFTTVLGLGQKYHFGKYFHFKVEFRNYTLLGTDSGFDSFFTLWAGFGLRL